MERVCDEKTVERRGGVSCTLQKLGAMVWTPPPSQTAALLSK
jgi:hypothetical protein